MAGDQYHGLTPERLKKGDTERATLSWVKRHRTDADPNPGLPYLVIGPLERMHRAGTITDDMKRGGEQFMIDFLLAGLDTLQAVDVSRLSSAWCRGDENTTVRIVDARKRLWAAFGALGGLDSLGGSICWAVLGCGDSIRKWTKQRGMQASYGPGALIMSLSVLASHYAGRR